MARPPNKPKILNRAALIACLTPSSMSSRAAFSSFRKSSISWCRPETSVFVAGSLMVKTLERTEEDGADAREGDEGRRCAWSGRF